MRCLYPLPFGATSLVGCADASGQVQGGEPLMLGTAFAAAGDGGPLGDAAFLDAGGACQPGGSQGGHTWTDLYACYFGPAGVVSCESQSICHGAADQQGARSSAYVCGPTQSDCYRGMLAGSLVTNGTTTDPATSLLYTVLCKDPSAGMGPGQMPLGCPPGTWLLPGDLARIGAWIKEGAPNN